MKYLYRVAQYGEYFRAEVTTAVVFGLFPNPFDTWRSVSTSHYGDEYVSTALLAIKQIDEHKMMNVPSKVTYA